MQRRDEQGPRDRDRYPQSVAPPPRACLLDWLFTLAIGLQITVTAIAFIPAHNGDALWWWVARTVSGLPLILLGATLVARSLKARERGDP